MHLLANGFSSFCCLCILEQRRLQKVWYSPVRGFLARDLEHPSRTQGSVGASGAGTESGDIG